jgi:hypothetical protein
VRTTTGQARSFDAALLILGTGFAFSMAANLLWTWEGGVVRILGGALASLALPGAIHLWPRIPVNTPVMRTIRAVVMTGIACMAAFTTFSHASELLKQHGEDPLLANLYPVMTELLVVMGVLARHAAPVVTPRVERAPRKPTVKSHVESSAGTATPPVVPAEPTELTERRDAAGTATEWARNNWPCTARKIQDETGVRKSSAHRIRNKVAEEMAS